MNLSQIINEEIKKFLIEGDVDWDYYEMKNEKMIYLFDDFLNKNNHDFTKTVKWSVVKYPRLKKIWEDFMRYGFVRDVKGLNMIEQKMVNNTMKVEIFTELAGHTSYDPEQHFDDAFRGFIENQIECYRIETTPFDKDQLEIDFDNGGKGKRKIEPKCVQPLHPYIKEFIEKNGYEELSNEELYKEIDELLRFKFYEYYMEDPKSGQAYISDYGLDPLLKLVDEVRRQTKPEDKLVTLDKMLNVVHMRSDIAAWFVEGGSSALTDLSGYEHDEESGTGVLTKQD